MKPGNEIPAALVDELLHLYQAGGNVPVVRHDSQSPSELTVASPAGGGDTFKLRYIAQLRPERIPLLAAEQFETGEKFVIATDYATNAIAEACVRFDLPFLDLAGNCYLNTSNSYISRQGKPRTVRPKGHVDPVGSISKPTAVRIMLVLLTSPKAYLNATYRELAAAAGVSLGSISATMEALQAMKLLHVGSNGQRMLLDHERMLDVFTEGYLARVRPALQKFQLTARQPFWHSSTTLDGGLVWGGEVAAARVLGDFNSAMQTIHATGDVVSLYRRLMSERHLTPAPYSGEIELVEACWGTLAPDTQEGLAPLPVVYAELMGSMEVRSVEAARRLRKFWAEHAHS